MQSVRSFTGAILVGATVALVMSACPGYAAASPMAIADDPTVDEILAKAVKAMGGEDAIQKIKTLHTVMEMSAQGMTIQMDMGWSRAGGRLSKTTTPMGEMEMGSDGKVAWMKGPAGYSLLGKAQARDLRNQAGMFMNILEPQRHLKEELRSTEVKGCQEFSDKKCVQVHFVNNDGEEGEMYFDLDTGLPVGFESVRKRGDREVRSRMLIGDWKAVEGVQFFHSMTMEGQGEAQPDMTMKVTTLELNKLEEKDFIAPEEVVKLASSSQPGGDSKEITLDDLTPEQRTQAQRMLSGIKMSGNVEAMKRMLAQLEPAMPHMPADQKPAMQYVMQELKKEIAKLGG